ncbi:MAG: hypothetical protein LAO55_25240 [Acidobacteriia bacterium]|nr:hypothetical protein [Terriglobia bacterium]
MAGLLLATYFCAQRVPFTSTALFQSAREFVFSSYGASRLRIYNNVNGRPFESCPSEEQQRTELFERMQPKVHDLLQKHTHEPQRIAALLAFYNRETTTFYRAPCRAGWVRRFDFMDYSYSFPGATPYIWLFRVFGLTEIYVSLWLMAAAYIGYWSAFLIGSAILRSNLGGLLVIAGIEIACRGLSRTGNDVLYMLLAFPLMLAGQLLIAEDPDENPADSPLPWWRIALRPWWRMAGLVLFGVFSVLCLFGLPIIIKMYAPVVAASVALIAVLQRTRTSMKLMGPEQAPVSVASVRVASNPQPKHRGASKYRGASKPRSIRPPAKQAKTWRDTVERAYRGAFTFFRLFVQTRRIALLRAGLAVLTLFVCRFPYAHYSAQLLAPVSAVDAAQSEEYVPVTMMGYTFERPSYHGFLIGDANYSMILLRDPLLANSGVVNLFQSFRPWSNYYWLDTFLHRPWLIFLHWWGRFFEVVCFHRFLSAGMYGPNTVIDTWIYWFGLLVLAVASLRFDRPVLWPVLGVVYFEIFGVSVLQGIIHTHALYYARGVWFLWALLPVTSVLICVRFRRVFETGPQAWGWIRTQAARRPKRQIACVAGCVLVLIWGLIRVAHREVYVYRIWTAEHYGLFNPESYRTHAWLVQQLDELQSLGSFEPGAVSMYAANVMYFQYAATGYHKHYLAGKLPVDYDAEGEKCRRSMMDYYRRALQEAPGNPNFYQYAQLFHVPEWVDIFTKALERFPNHPYRAKMADDLANAGILPKENARIAADALGALYRDTARYRPGYRRLPDVTGPQPVMASRTPEGIHVRLEPHQEIWLDQVNTYGSDRYKLALYIRSSAGGLELCIATVHGCRSAPSMVTPDDLHPYHVFETNPLEPDEANARVVIKTRGQGADFVLRDLYPLLENPRFYN